MGHTKQDQDETSCYAKARPEEPIFVLLGRDPAAWLVVMQWAAIRQALGKTDPEQVRDAEECARAMATYADSIGKAAERTVAHSTFFELYKLWQADDKLRTAQRELLALRSQYQELLSASGQYELLIRDLGVLAGGTDEQVAELCKNEAYQKSDVFQTVLGLRDKREGERPLIDKPEPDVVARTPDDGGPWGA